MMGDYSAIEWTDRELGWLEGLIDSEGAFTISKQINRPHKYRDGRTWKVRLAIGNTNYPFLEHAQELIGGCIFRKSRGKRVGNWKPCYELQVYSTDLRRLLPKIELIVKEGQRSLVLEMLDILQRRKGAVIRFHPESDHGTSRLRQIETQMKVLNHRGL